MQDMQDLLGCDTTATYDCATETGDYGAGGTGENNDEDEAGGVQEETLILIGGVSLVLGLVIVCCVVRMRKKT